MTEYQDTRLDSNSESDAKTRAKSNGHRRRATPGSSQHEERQQHLEAVAVEYRNLGHSPIPLPNGQKQPPPKGIIGYKGRRPDEKDYKNWHGTWGNIALALSRELRVVGIDLDLHKHVPACQECADATNGLGPRETRETVLKQHGYDPLPPSRWSTSRDDGSGIAMFRVPAGTELATDIPGGLGETIQFFHRYVVCWPSIHPDTCRTYRWLDDDGNEVDIPGLYDLADLPDTETWLQRLQRPERGESTGHGYSGDVTEWMNALVAGEMDGSVYAALDKHLAELDRRNRGEAADEDDGASRYSAMIKATGALVSLGAGRHRGVYEAINTYCDEYRSLLAGEPDRDPDGELARAIEGAVAEFGKPVSWYEKQVKLQSPERQEDDFWGSHAQLAYIREVAAQQIVPPWALLGAVLARVTAASDWRIILPDIIGDYASPNLYVGVVGISGEGKSGPMALAKRLVPVEITTCKAGTGEGVAKAFVHRQPQREGGRLVQHNHNALISVTEVTALTAIAERKGSTIISILRELWMGEEIGFQNSNPETRITVAAHSYRAAMVVGIQPKKAGVILDDIDAGLPQRFLYLSGVDPELAADEPEEEYVRPEITPLSLSESKPLRQLDGEHRVVKVWPKAAWQIRQAARDRTRGLTQAIDGHRLLLQEKVSWALGQITGSSPAEIREEDWQRAETVMDVSDGTYDRLIDAQHQAARQANTMRAKGEAERELIKDDVIRDQAVVRVATAIMRKVKKSPGELTRKTTRGPLNSRDRDYFDDALQQLTDAGQLEIDDRGHYWEAE